MTIRNLLAQPAVIIAADQSVITTLSPSGTVAIVVPGSAAAAPPIDGIPVVDFARPASVTGLPEASDPDPILVSAIVADAMRQLGLRHPAGVYTPQPLVFDAARKPVGAPGLIHHADLS